MELPPFGRVQRSFPEGSIPVEVADPKLGIEPAVAVVETNFFARPFLSPTFVVNPDRAALVVWEKAHYAANPADAPPNEHKLAGNRVVHEFSSVSHVFESFPQQIKVEGKKGTRTRVGTLAPPELPQEMMAFAALSMLGPDDGKAVVWRWAYAQPDNEVFLGIVANRAGDDSAAEKLKPRLADRPVLVEWHRAYQNLKDKDPALVAEYEGTWRRNRTTANWRTCWAGSSKTPRRNESCSAAPPTEAPLGVRLERPRSDVAGTRRIRARPGAVGEGSRTVAGSPRLRDGLRGCVPGIGAMEAAVARVRAG